jgi:hypothetical protein
MVNWQKELKNFLAKKFNEMVDDEEYHVSPENIMTIEIDFDLQLDQLTDKELTHIYAYAVMKEDFEAAKKLTKEINNRSYDVRIDIDEKENIGLINVVEHKNPNKTICSVPMKVYPDGLMVDFEKEDDF